MATVLTRLDRPQPDSTVTALTPRGKSVNARPQGRSPIHVPQRPFTVLPFPLPNATGVVPQSPGLRGFPRYPWGVQEVRNNHNVVVPEERM